jgi:phage-related tail fiber protein
VQAYRLDQFAAPTADLTINSQRLTNVADGTGAQDAATFGQVSALLNGRTFKDAVRIASTANLAAISSLTAIDGVTPVAGDRILLKDQTTASQNGIWIAASGAWTRATDADSVTPDAELKAGTSVFVNEGTANGDKQFTLTTNGPITVGTTALTWAVSGAGTTYTQGNGITISGSTISVDPAVTCASSRRTSATARPRASRSRTA